MHLKRTLRRAILPDRSELLARLRAAILKGDLSENDLIEGRWREISAATGGVLFEDSLDTIEFVMALEENGVTDPTVGDLIHLLTTQQQDRNKE